MSLAHGDAFTVILLVWNRFQYIDQTADFYRNMPFRVIVADSSQAPNGFDVAGQNIEYIYNGAIHYFENIRKSLAQVTTPYVVIMTDDDIMMPTVVDRFVSQMKRDGALAAYGANLFFDGEYLQKRASTAPFTTIKRFFTHEAFLPLNHGVVETTACRDVFDLVAEDPHLMTIRCHDAVFSLACCLTVPPILTRELYFLNRQSSLVFTKGQRPDPALQALYPTELRREVSFEAWLDEYCARPPAPLDRFVAERRGVSPDAARAFILDVFSGLDSRNKDRRASLARQSRRWKESVGRTASQLWNAWVAGRDSQPHPGGRGTVSRILARERRAVLGRI